MKRRYRYLFRDSVTGQFCTEIYSIVYPRTTQRHRIEIKPVKRKPRVKGRRRKRVFD